MFGRAKGETAPPVHPENVTESVLAPNLAIKGSITFEGSVRLEGELQGNITGQGRLTVGRGGRIVGDIVAAEVVVEGLVQGNITASDRVEVAGTGQVAGDLRAARLVVSDGAKLRGCHEVDSDSMTAAPSASEAKPQPAEAAPATAGGDRLEKLF